MIIWQVHPNQVSINDSINNEKFKKFSHDALRIEKQVFKSNGDVCGIILHRQYQIHEYKKLKKHLLFFKTPPTTGCIRNIRYQVELELKNLKTCKLFNEKIEHTTLKSHQILLTKNQPCFKVKMRMNAVDSRKLLTITNQLTRFSDDAQTAIIKFFYANSNDNEAENFKSHLNNLTTLEEDSWFGSIKEFTNFPLKKVNF